MYYNKQKRDELEMDSKNVDVKTARDYALVGLIFYGLVFGAELIMSLVRYSIPELNFMERVSRKGLWIRDPEFSLIGIGVLLIITIFFVYWAFRTYKQIENGNYEAARTPTLMLGIFGLFPFFGGVIGGILFLLCYAKLGDVLRSDQRPHLVDNSAKIQG